MPALKAPHPHASAAGAARDRQLILPVQYLRGIAAMMVVWHHATAQIPAVAALFPSAFGTSGVDLFFVISGFIMVVTTHGSAMTPWQFLKRRMVRVIPPYWILTLLMIALALAAPGLFKTLQLSGATVVQSLLFIPHYSLAFPQQAWPVLVPGWTLNFEMFFYALFALSMGLRPAWRVGGLALAIGALVTAGAVFGPFRSAIAVTYTSPLLLEFGAGALIGRWWSADKRALPLGLSLACLAVGAMLLVLRDTAPFGTFNPFFGATLLVIGAVDRRAGHLHWPVLQTLGDASYAIYLTHLFTLGILRTAWGKLGPETTSLTTSSCFMALALVACALAGCVAYRLGEKPLLERLVKLRRADSTPVTAR